MAPGSGPVRAEARLVGIVVLAGGTGQRLGGAEKSLLPLQGYPLWRWMVASLARAGLAQLPRVLVTPRLSAIDARGFAQTCEEPPRSGPAAAVVTGAHFLQADSSAPTWCPDDYLAVLPVDAPLSALALPLLLASASTTAREDGAALAFMAQAQGQVQRVTGIMSATHLGALTAGDYRNCSMRRLLETFSLHQVPVPPHLVIDIDTPADRQRMVQALESLSEVERVDLLQQVGQQWADDADAVFDATVRAGGVDHHHAGRSAFGNSHQCPG